MDEEVYDEESAVTPMKRKTKKSKKRKHEESEASEESKKEESEVEKSKIEKSKSSKKEAKKRSYEEDEASSDQDDLFQQESIKGDDGDDRLEDEVASYEFFGEEQSPAEETANKPTETYEYEPFSCVEHQHRQIKFALLPIAILRELEVIKNTLIYDWKYSFIHELNGFLYYFDNLKLVEEDRFQIMDDLPFIYPRITADFYVFRPKVGEYLKATISCFEDSNKVINCSTSCQLTISIQLPEKIDDRLNKYLKLHQDIIFLIESINYRLMLIEGTINERSLKLMADHVEIKESVDEQEAGQQESNLDDFFA